MQMTIHLLSLNLSGRLICLGLTTCLGDTGRESTHVAEPGASDVNVEDLFGNVQEQLQFSGFQENVDSERDWTHVTDHSVQSVNDCAIPDEVDLVEREASGPVVSSSTWNQLVAGSVPTFVSCRVI